MTGTKLAKSSHEIRPRMKMLRGYLWRHFFFVHVSKTVILTLMAKKILVNLNEERLKTMEIRVN